MTPTPAQIGAAQLAKWIRELQWKSIDKDNMEFEVRTTCYVRDALLKWAEFTAAAEAGGQTETVSWPKIKNLLIERCAQVADDKLTALGYIGLAATVTAAIRALKDKP